jgi:SPP1 family predicted phage head-tail adaptor
VVKCCGGTMPALRKAVLFQRKTQVANGTGGWTETWATLAGAPVRAAFEPMSGNEAFRNGRVEAGIKARVTVRYFAGLREADRILIDSRAHNIRYIRNVEARNRWLEIDVDGGVAT